MNLNSFKTGVMREIWEHKIAFIWGPLVLAGFITLLLGIAAIKGVNSMESRALAQHFENSQNTIATATAEIASQPMAERVEATKEVFSVSKMLFDVFMLVIAFYYFANTFFDERKDRSIYFWRSMPVSDWQTLGSKLFAGAIVLPVTYLIGLLALHIIVRLLLSVLILINQGTVWSVLWEPSFSLLGDVLMMPISYVVAFLWALPLVGFLLLAGAATKRPLLYIILTPVVIALAEEVVFDSSVFASWLADRLTGVATLLWSGMESFGRFDFPKVGMSTGAELFGHPQFWFGLVIGCGFLLASIVARKRLQEV